MLWRLVYRRLDGYGNSLWQQIPTVLEPSTPDWRWQANCSTDRISADSSIFGDSITCGHLKDRLLNSLEMQEMGALGRVEGRGRPRQMREPRLLMVKCGYPRGSLLTTLK